MDILGACFLFLLHCSLIDATNKCSSGDEMWESGLLEGDKEEILEVHNRIREEIASGQSKVFADIKGLTYLPKAQNMRKMVWCDECEKLAQEQANGCSLEPYYTDITNGKNYGQTAIGGSFSSRDEAIVRDWTNAIYLLYDLRMFRYTEIKNYQHALAAQQFTTLAWANTYSVGCGFVAYNGSFSGERNEAHGKHICKYYTRGNREGEDVYLAGEPCKVCTCDTKYPHLCADVPKTPQDTD